MGIGPVLGSSSLTLFPLLVLVIKDGHSFCSGMRAVWTTFQICIQFNGALCFKQCTGTKIDFTPNAVNSRVVDHPIIVGSHETSDSWNGTDVVTTNTIMYRLLGNK